MGLPSVQARGTVKAGVVVARVDARLAVTARVALSAFTLVRVDAVSARSSVKTRAVRQIQAI